MPEPAAPADPAAPMPGQLLRHAATGAPLARERAGLPWRDDGDDRREFQWVLDGGFGPLLHHATRGCRELLPPRWRDVLLAAELSAQVRHGNHVDTLLEAAAICDPLGVTLTLLKGISVSAQWYPREHLRPMSDVDVLITAADYDRVETALLARGFERVDQPALPGLQHGIPLCRQRCGTVLELHTTLFPAGSLLSRGHLFNPAGLAARSVPARYHGRPVRRLDDTLQLAYIASSWFNDLTERQVHPSFLGSLFDAVYLLRSAGPALDWHALPLWLDNEMAAASLHTLATYVPRHGVAPLPADGLHPLAAAARRLAGPLQRRWMHAMLDAHLIAGRPWPHALPPPVPGRYSPGHQFHKRVWSRLVR